MENEVIDKICSRAFALAVIGTCIIGICPAFGIMTLSTSATLKRKNIELNELNSMRIKKGNILAVISLFMFAVDVAIVMFVFNRLSH